MKRILVAVSVQGDSHCCSTASYCCPCLLLSN